MLIIPYETLQNHLDAMIGGSYGCIVCDEAHRLKNTETLVYKALHPLRSQCRIMISGTPIQNNCFE